MEIVDAQLHLDAEHDADTLCQMMAGVGVDAAVLVQSGKQPTAEPIVRAAATHPGTFGLVAANFRPDARDLEAQLTAWREQPDAVGVRVVLRTEEERERFDADEWEPLIGTVQRLGLPLLTATAMQFDRWERLAVRHPDLQIVVDHLGLRRPPAGESGPDPWELLPRLLSLARYENVAVKLTRAPTLSDEPFPFRDLWPHLHAVIEAFGLERLMWGSDITEIHGLHTYREAVDYVRESDELSPSDKQLLMGGSLRRLLRWHPGAATG